MTLTRNLTSRCSRTRQARRPGFHPAVRASAEFTQDLQTWGRKGSRFTWSINDPDRKLDLPVLTDQASEAVRFPSCGPSLCRVYTRSPNPGAKTVEIHLGTRPPGACGPGKRGGQVSILLSEPLSSSHKISKPEDENSRDSPGRSTTLTGNSTSRCLRTRQARQLGFHPCGPSLCLSSPERDVRANEIPLSKTIGGL
ncbi:hypothetical protein O6P43_010203 [Quillaja saponaria]|uniref:Uncharacterized protein n=1 Tax=Quillaja saponaria TaxID=32244 RepID=A0AAD7VE27_QUISA|nr:hypothetical protein O6P43_010203 [Quillaja saponaria]